MRKSYRHQARRTGLDGAPRPTPAQDAMRERQAAKDRIRSVLTAHIRSGGLITAPETLLDAIWEAVSGEDE